MVLGGKWINGHSFVLAATVSNRFEWTAVEKRQTRVDIDSHRTRINEKGKKKKCERKKNGVAKRNSGRRRHWRIGRRLAASIGAPAIRRSDQTASRDRRRIPIVRRWTPVATATSNRLSIGIVPNTATDSWWIFNGPLPAWSIIF